MNTYAKGFTYGAVAAASYGLNPLFTLPLFQAGMNADSVLFYRYFFACLLLGIMMKLQKRSFSIKKSEFFPLVAIGLLFSFSSLFLFVSYNYMDAGVASTILFIYPVLVALIMAFFFHEKISVVTMLSIGLAFLGISLLYQGGDGKTLNSTGVLLVILSSLTYAIYIIAVNRSFLRTFPSDKLTFYALLFGIIVYVVRLNFCIDLQPVPSPALWINVISLTLFPTIISLMAMTRSIHYIGSTLAAILGALEPLTALFFGVVVFGEKLTPRIILGVLLVLTAVTLIVIAKPLGEVVKKRIRHRHGEVA